MACPEPQSYQYTPLTDKREIRLLRVENSSSTNQGYQFTLLQQAIDDVPAYEALSYVWGLNIRDRILPLYDGRVLRVTGNLEKAISKIAQHCTTGYLWIDQICINQEDVEERNEQVKNMGLIYGRSFQVLVWLGPIDLPHCDALDWICRGVNEYIAMGHSGAVLTQYVQTLLLGDVLVKNKQLIFYQDDCELALWQLYKILGASWYDRGWVYQEVVLSSRSKFVLQSSTVSLAGLYWICKAIDKIEGDGSDFIGLCDVVLEASGLKMVPMMYRSWSERHQPDSRSGSVTPRFERFLSKVAPAVKTSDPRDHVYAFLALNDDNRIQIQPEYRHSVDEVFGSATRAIIQGTGRLDILEVLCRQGDYDGTRPFVRRCPSWVPEFRSPEHIKPFSRSTTSLQISESVHMYPHVGPIDTAILVAHGRLLDRIHSRIEPRLPPHGPGTWFDFDHYVTSAVRAWEISRRHYTSPTRKSVFEALVAQGHCESEPVPSLFAEYLRNDNLPDMLSWVIEHYFRRLEVKPGAPEEIHSGFSMAQIEKAISAILTVTHMRYLFVTESGRLALGCTLEIGDEICLLHGSSNPVALRSAGDGRHNVQETCFLEGWMDPWANNKIDWKEDEADEFFLI